MDSTNGSKLMNPVSTLASDASHVRPSPSISNAMPPRTSTTSEAEKRHSIVNVARPCQSTVPSSGIQGPLSSSSTRPRKRHKRTKKLSHKSQPNLHPVHRNTSSSSSDSDATFHVKKLRRSLCPVKANLNNPASISSTNRQRDISNNQNPIASSSTAESDPEIMKA